MKRPSNKKEPVISITATLSETRLLKKLVEKLATNNRRRSPDITGIMQPGWRYFGTSSLEAFVSGNIHVVNQSNLLKKPFVKGFVFTCMNADSGEYDLVWGSSLS